MDLYKDKVLKMEVEEFIKLVRCMAEWDGFTKKGHIKNNSWCDDWYVNGILQNIEGLRDHCNQIISRAEWLKTYEIDMNSL